MESVLSFFRLKIKGRRDLLYKCGQNTLFYNIGLHLGNERIKLYQGLNMRFINVIIFIVALNLTGCASTTLTSYTDPAFANKQYKSFIVDYGTSDLDRKIFVEKEVVRLLKEKGIAAYTGLMLFPPTRKFTEKEAAKLIMNTGAEGYITITLTNAYTTSSYVPPTYTTTQNYYGGYTTSSSGGYSVTKPRESFKVELIDIASGKKAYQATGKTRGTAHSNAEGMSKILALGLVEKLIEDKILIPMKSAKKQLQGGE